MSIPCMPQVWGMLNFSTFKSCSPSGLSESVRTFFGSAFHINPLHVWFSAHLIYTKKHHVYNTRHLKFCTFPG